MNKDKKILRELASKYFEYANSDLNRDRMKLHKAVNDLKMVRPTVLINEIPWGEFFGSEIILECEDPYFQSIEAFLRISIYQWINFPGDMVLPPYFRVGKVIHSSGIGVGKLCKDERENTESQTHTFVDQLDTEEDLMKLHNEVITYDEEETKKNFERVADVFGDILPVKITGEATGYGLGCKTWDDIVFLRGLDNLFYDMADRPEFIHKTVRIFTDIFLDKVRQYNELGLFDGDAYYTHCSSALTNDLHPDQNHVNSKDIWGRGLAQILASVSPEMHDEFDIQYMIEAMKPFGLVYYGCCEPLHHKIHILEQIPNLRKISITPWADMDMAADNIGKRYVMSAKPNPSALAIDHLDKDVVRKEIRHILEAGKRNGCAQELLLKDITTIHSNPSNLKEWAKIAMEEVQNT